jgi:hypothetical protein
MAGPYELQSPKDIAMEYGGNKQKIAQAAQMGLVDPTAAVLAGMFIDKMRTAQQDEMAPQTTVAQEVMAPPMAPQMGGQMPAEAGVAALPVPDEMVPDEFAGGGIIAFDNGGGVSIEEEIEAYRPRGISSLFGLMPQGIGAGNIDYTLGQLGYTRDQIAKMDPAMKRYVAANATAPTAPTVPTAAKPTTPATTPTTPGGPVAGPGATQPAAQADDFASYLSRIEGAMPGGQALEGLEKDIKADREARKEEKSQAGWMSLAMAGLNVAAGTSPFALVNLGKGLSEGLKNYAEELKSQKKLDREDKKLLADIEKARRDEKRGNVTAALGSYEKALDRLSAEDRQRIAAETSERVARIGAESRDQLGFLRDRLGKGETMVDIRDILKRNPYVEPTR